MATKVKPSRLKVTGTPQVGQVPVYVDEDSFQWADKGGGSDIEYVTQAEYNALPSSKLTDNKHYFIYSTSGGGGWTPTADTIIYYDFENDSGTTVTNQIAGGVNATTSSALSISSLPSGKKYATLSGSTSLNNIPLYTNSAPTFNMNSFTTTCWFKINTAPSFNFVIWCGNWWSSDADNSICLLAPNSSYTEMQFALRNGGETSISPNTIPNANDGNRHCISCISTSTYTRIIMDGQVIGSGGNGGSTSNGKTIKFGWYGSGSAVSTSMSFGAIILGNIGWSDSDCISYYNLTKGDYGIS